MSGLMNSWFSNRFPNVFTISSGIFGLCSINLSNSDLQLLIKSRPLIDLCETGKDNSTAMFLENLEYAIDAALWPSKSSLTLKNCAIVVSKPASKLKKPITAGT